MYAIRIHNGAIHNRPRASGATVRHSAGCHYDCVHIHTRATSPKSAIISKPCTINGQIVQHLVDDRYRTPDRWR
jgi:hypothetical protein